MYREIKEEELKVDITLGYIYFLDKNHPLSNKDTGKVYYHRHVASLSNNRWLTSEECVHHIDENKLNNSKENLLVLSNAEHALIHKATNYIKLACKACHNIFEVKESEKNRLFCSFKCSTNSRLLWNPNKSDLELLIWHMSYVAIGKAKGLSDTAIKKKAKTLGCLMPPPYFFNKTEEYRKEQRRINNVSDLSPQQSSKLLA